jgi:hypothetical protein
MAAGILIPQSLHNNSSTGEVFLPIAHTVSYMYTLRFIETI